MLDPHKGPFPPLASPWVYADGNDATCPVSHSCPHHSFSMMHYCPTRERFHFKFGATPRKYSASGSNLKGAPRHLVLIHTYTSLTRISQLNYSTLLLKIMIRIYTKIR